MEKLDRLAEKLRAVAFDRTRLTDAQHAEVFNLARAAGVELYRGGAIWPSSEGAGLTGGEVTGL